MVECDIFVGGVLDDGAPGFPYLIIVTDFRDRQHVFRASPDAITGDGYLKGRCTGADTEPIEVILFSGRCEPGVPMSEGRDFWGIEVLASTVRKHRPGDGSSIRPKGMIRYLGMVTEPVPVQREETADA